MKCFTVVFLITISACTVALSGEYEIVSKVSVQPVWSCMPVAFTMETLGNRQFVCFYAADRSMTAGQRMLGSSEWTFQKLPSQISWDSHNSIVMAVDETGTIHISGNMHGDPLIYFRSEKPCDITSLKAINHMTGEREQKVTYPKFMRGSANDLIFTYRDGGSGNGVRIYNKYDPQTRTWSRLLDAPLLDGDGKMNAYPNGPVQGPDGRFHIAWVWRNSPDCSSCHDLCYACSKDLVHWETAEGEPIQLPIRPDTLGVVVDPVPPGQGMINGNGGKIGFDSMGRVVLSYHKFDADGHTQIYNARLEAGKWNIVQTSDWDFRWEFSGRGSIPFEVKLSEVKITDGKLNQYARNSKDGSQTWELDEQTLKPAGTIDSKKMPKEISHVRSDFPKMRVKTLSDKESGKPYYLLRWETLPNNRDQERSKPWPEPSMLEIYELK